jgi:glycosyltransferase involved in cell wall biosynthesis
MKVSIITATYNSDKTLEKCLESVAKQTAIREIEHIIIDGVSSDNSLQIVSNFPHVKKIISAEDRGIFHAFNRGVEMSSGDIIYFLGSDDFLHDDQVIYDVISYFNAAEVDYVLARVLCFFNDSDQKWLTDYQLDREGAHPCHQGFFCKKVLFEKIGLFSECFKIVADSFFMKFAIANFHGLHIDRTVACFRQGGISSTVDNQKIIQRELQAMRLLLNEERISRESELNNNITTLKLLMHKALVDERYFSFYQGMRVAVFGTRELSILVCKLMIKAGAVVTCFLTSTKQELPEIDGIKISSLSENQNNTEFELVFNCIEGIHEAEVTTNIQQILPNVKVVSWREL